MMPATETGAHFRSLFQGERLVVGEWICRADHDHDHPPAVEHTASHEIVIPRRGSYLRHLGRQRIFADPTRTVFANPDEEYTVSHPVEHGDECTAFFLEPTLVAEMLGRDPADGAPVRFAQASALVSSRLFILHRMLLDSLRSSPGDHLAGEAQAIDLLQAVATPEVRVSGGRPRRVRTEASHRDIVDQVQRILLSDLGSTLSLEEVGRHTYTSPFHLVRIFTRQTGLPIHRYRMLLRLRRALEEVLDTRRDLSTIALELGFASHSHLTAAFHREFGVAPSVLRRNTSTCNLRRLMEQLQDAVRNGSLALREEQD